MSSIPSDASLYEAALAVNPSMPVLQVSPATFKSIISSVLELLIGQRMPAIVWAKLPRGDAWNAELEDYTMLSGVSKAVYSLKNYQEEPADDIGMVSLALATNREAAAEATVPTAETAFFSIQLPLDSQLRRDYFLIVWSASLQTAIVAQRLRTVPTARALTEPSSSAAETAAPEIGQQDAADRKQLLLALNSLEPTIVEQLLVTVEHAIARAQLQSPAAISTVALASAASTNPAEYWQAFMAEMPVTGANLQQLGQLFVRQVQKQEELWQRGVAYRRQAETAETLQVQNQELTHAIRLKDDFLSNMGQELRTPLTTIKTALSLLNSPALKAPQRQRYLNLIAQECDRQSSLITSLLNLIQIDQMADQAVLQPQRLSDIVPGVVSTYQPLAEEKGVQLAYTVPEDLPPVACANNWMQQIVIHLLNNAIKFTPRGGQVWVRTKRQGDYIQLEFRDTGIGIAPGEVPKIFERFYRVRQTAEDSSGAGLGLTIVQQLLLHLGGSISVKSRPGEGSAFNVLLPVYKSPAE